MDVNDPTIVAEVRALVDRYDCALVGNDLRALEDLFWRSELTIRYGASERLYGADAIAAFRAARPGGQRPREILRTEVTSFGADVATAHVEFLLPGSRAIGLQSQTWVRLDEGWRIVAAHVSYLAAG